MKIGILSQWYDPEPGPAALPGVYAREFTKLGHEVTVLTGYPNYPDGKLYEGYRQRGVLREQIDGVHITRVPLVPSHSSSGVGRAANYLSFALSATLAAPRALSGVDAIWVYNSPVTVALPLLTRSRFGRIPVFLHVQDLWPDSLLESGMIPRGAVSAVAERVINKIVRLTENRSAVVGVISPGVRQLLLDRNSALAESKVVYAPNPANEKLFTCEARTSRCDDQSSTPAFELMYAGAIGEVQGLDTLLAAAKLLRERTDIRITVVGDGISRARLQKLAVEDSLTNVTFVGRVPEGEIPGLIARADAQLVSLSESPFLAYTTPSKIPSLLASGVPVIGHIAGDGARLIAASGAGPVVTPGDAVGLRDAIISLADSDRAQRARFGQRGRDYYEKHLSAASTAQTILDALFGAVGRQKTREAAR